MTAEALAERKEEMQARIEEMEARREEMQARFSDSTERRTEMKARMEERRVAMQERMEARKAEMKEREEAMLSKMRARMNFKEDSVFMIRRPINASEYSSVGTKANTSFNQGVGFLHKESKVLFFLNGEEINEHEFKMLKPEEIESIDILKGENAKALYQEKMEGKEAVMLITTKVE